MRTLIELDRFGWIVLWERYPARALRIMEALRREHDSTLDLRAALKRKLANYDQAAHDARRAAASEQESHYPAE